MEKANTKQSQFFRDLGATMERFVQEVRGFEGNYYNLIREMWTTLPWLADFNTKSHRYAEQDFAAALEFAREVRRANDTSDFVHVYVLYLQKSLQSFTARAMDFAETYMKVVSGAPTFCSPK
jgi:hypothetical protein